MGVPAGVALANLIFLVMGSMVAPEAFQAWGWRIPFLLSILLVALGLYVQLKLEDTAEFKALEKAENRAERKGSPILQVIARHPKEILLGAGAFVAANGTFYVMITYAVAYATKELHVARTTILWVVMLGSLISAPALPLMAALSDRLGRRGVFMTGALLCGLWSVPFFLLLNTGSFPLMLLAMTIGMIANDLMYGPQAALMTELFSTELRYSGASLGYQIGAIAGGGFAPIICTALFERYQSSLAISGYWAALCAVAFVSVFLLSETNRRAPRVAAKAAA
jgi:MFS family permease